MAVMLIVYSSAHILTALRSNDRLRLVVWECYAFESLGRSPG